MCFVQCVVLFQNVPAPLLSKNLIVLNKISFAIYAKQHLLWWSRWFCAGIRRLKSETSAAVNRIGRASVQSIGPTIDPTPSEDPPRGRTGTSTVTTLFASRKKKLQLTGVRRAPSTQRKKHNPPPHHVTRTYASGFWTNARELRQ